MRPKVHTKKHYAQQSIESVAAGALSNLVIADSVENVAANNQVREGSSISAIYVEMWCKSGAASNLASVINCFYKEPGSGVAFTVAQLAAVQDAENKKNILYFQQGLLGNEDQIPLPVVKQWFKIPKSKQRMGLGDRWIFVTSATGIDVDRCGFATFKEQY